MATTVAELGRLDILVNNAHYLRPGFDKPLVELTDEDFHNQLGAGLMARTFTALTRASLGYQPEHVLTLRAQLAFRKFAQRDDMLAQVH